MADKITAEKEEKEVSSSQSPEKEVSPVGGETTQKTDTVTSSSSDTDSQTEEQKTEEQKEQTTEKRPSRLEKRVEELEQKKEKIESLLNKLKGRPTTVGYQPPPQPIVREEDFIEGLTPEELERRFFEREQQIKQATKAEVMAELEFRNAIINHISQLEEIGKRMKEEGHEDLEPIFAEQYELSNRIYNPLTGQYDFAPQFSPEEIYEKVKRLKEEWLTKGSVKSSLKLAEQAESQALRPTPTKKEEEVPLEKLRELMKKDPKMVRKYLESRLPVSEE